MRKIILKIEGMTCSACSNGLEKYLKKQKGIKNVSVNLILALATIEYDNLKISEIENYINRAGFKSLGEFKNFESDNYKKDIYKLILMGIILLFLMFLVIGKMFNLEIFFIKNNLCYSASLFLITIIYLIYGKDILKSGLLSIYYKIPNMDTLVLLSISVSFLYSLYGLIRILFGNIDYVNNLYFESVCMVIYFIKLGRFIELQNRNKTKEAIKDLVQITPVSATIKENDIFKEVSIDEVKVDDILVCRPGEKIAVDGIVIDGKTHVDESFITGESQPVLKEKNDKVIAGSINYDGYIEYKAKNIGRNSMISEIVKMVVEATNNKSRIQAYTDKISGYFVYIIITIAVLTLTIQLLLGIQLNNALINFATILVVACPCSLGLAVPLVMVIGNGICAKKGLFIRNNSIFELAESIDTVIFDKTNTLTYGNLEILKLYNYSNYSDKELFNLVANIEKYSTHPIKSAFKISKKIDVLKFQNISGKGITGIIDNKVYYLGNKKILEENDINDFKEDNYLDLVKQGASIIYIVENKKIIGLIGVRDIVRKEAKETIKKLQSKNINVYLLTGDTLESANIIANELGIKEVYASKTPQEKAIFVEQMIKDNKKVMMVGDGINDAIALVKATIGVSINEGCDVAIDSSSVVLMNNNIKNILDLIEISKQSFKIIKQNLFWAFFYNFCMILIAIGLFKEYGLSINPMIASVMMTLSSLCVVFNSLRLRRIYNERD